MFRNTPQTALSIHYFIYFGIMGIYLPYFNLYCYHLGFNGYEIGRIAAFRTFTFVLFPLLWSFVADFFQIRRPLFIACCLINTAIWSGLFFTTSFWPILMISFVQGIFYSPLISFLEAFTMDMLGRARKNYGRIRWWGSISFIAMVLLIGRLVDTFPLKLIITLIFGGSLIQCALAVYVPKITIKRGDSLRSGLKALLRPSCILFLLSAFLMLLSHGAYYGFFSIHLENLGFSKSFIGFTWAVASSAEITVMLASAKLFKRFSVNHVLLFAFAVAAFRWAVLAIVESGPLIVLSQLLHAVTYGAFHMASILYIDQIIPSASKTIGQAVNNAATYGLGLMVGFELSGRLYASLGSAPLFLVSSGVAICGGIILLVSHCNFSKKGA